MKLPCLMCYPVLTLGGLLVAVVRIMLFLTLAKDNMVELAHGEVFHEIKGMNCPGFKSRGGELTSARDTTVKTRENKDLEGVLLLTVATYMSTNSRSD